MNQETKNSILIIGGGLIGLSIAYEFARNNFKVLVLSKNRNESAGFVAAGMLATHAEGLEDELLKFGQESQSLIPKWIKSCLLYTSPSPRDRTRSRMPSSA